MEDAGREHGVGDFEPVGEVVQRAGAAGGDDGDGDALADGAEQPEVVARLRAVAVHARHEELARAAVGGLGGPLHRVYADRLAPAVREDLPAGRRAAGLLGVHGDDHALRAEPVGGGGEELGLAEGGGVDRHLVGPGVEHPSDIGYGADAAADGERDEDGVGGAAHDLGHRGAALVRGRDVEEDELVGAGLVVDERLLHGVARVAEVDEVHAFDDAAVVDVQAGDDALGQHAGGA